MPLEKCRSCPRGVRTIAPNSNRAWPVTMSRAAHSAPRGRLSQILTPSRRYLDRLLVVQI
jgi:hypothetical protein